MASSLLVLLGILMAVGTQAGVMQFGMMVYYMTKRFPLTSYVFYGCYCGIGGHGRPLDEIDWCCQIHDCCYGALSSPSCSPFKQFYLFTLTNGTVICDDANLKGCARQCCECDRAAALCFAEQDRYYNEEYQHNPSRENCYGTDPICYI
ncbi:acidic phospholipase A2 Cc1-PLA2-like [Leptodactylus fuscus]|uniref:acidic phospholipase A2 Cc1-PLA2-like n=1 Tax=Leptodactylus fuscus TaxID=238119 RepID=UPI003F4E89EF